MEVNGGSIGMSAARFFFLFDGDEETSGFSEGTASEGRGFSLARPFSFFGITQWGEAFFDGLLDMTFIFGRLKGEDAFIGDSFPSRLVFWGGAF